MKVARRHDGIDTGASRRIRTAGITLVALLLLAAPPAQAAPNWSDLGSKTFDVLVLRPLGTVGTIAGFALFLPTALIASPGGEDSIIEAWDLFVGSPAQAAFQRPLGDF
jgi:hypothetical protein